LGELGSVTEKRFEVKWVTELSRGIERLCDGGLGAAVLDLNLPDSKGVETFDKFSAQHVPFAQYLPTQTLKDRVYGFHANGAPPG
jgi:DNA-binding response OmpR family regulator